jgi:hypothetical protein
MREITTHHEVWDGMGEMRGASTDQAEAWRILDEVRADGTYAKIHRHITFPCGSCGAEVRVNGGHDGDCDNCGAEYNSSGRRLRSNRHNPSEWDEDISDMDGYEIEMAGDY